MYTQVLSVRFTATKSGTYDVHVAFGRDLVKNAPFRIAVFEYAHGHICPSSCPCLHLHQYVCERGWR